MHLYKHHALIGPKNCDKKWGHELIVVSCVIVQNGLRLE
jgi:hypothetical protein